MKILFSGGGTLGPVTPLLAMIDTITAAKPETKVIWCATKHGPERELMKQRKVTLYTIPSGKLRRYWSLLNIVDIFKILGGFFVAFRVLWSENPDVCISAGGYVSVPVHIAAWMLGVPTWIHQQDVSVGLANKLMTPFAMVITTALQETTKKFPSQKTHWLGNPIRAELLEGSAARAKERFHLNSDLPVVFATGGGTGSLRVNQLVVEATEHLRGVAEVIHLSGKERPQELIERAVNVFPHYHGYQFFTEEMKDAYAVATVVISRGGFGTLTELAALSKAAIIIPKPGHQEDNIAFAVQAKAVIALDERTASGLELAQKIKTILQDGGERSTLGKNLYALLPPAKAEVVLHTLDALTTKN